MRHNCEGSLPKSVGYALRNASARLGRRITRYVDQYIVLTEFQKRYFMEQGIPEALLAVVPNHAEPAPEPLPAAGPLVTMIGRVSPEKGVGDFLELARRLPDIPFALAGEIRPTMRAPLADAPTNVRVLGHLDAVPRAALMADTRIVVLCNRWYEGFPNAALEAMALGKPVVAPALGALPEIVDDGVTGLLYPPGELAAAAEALRFLHADPARAAAMGAAARRKVAAQFQAEHAYLAYLNAFQRARAHASAEEALEIDAASAPA